MLSYFTDKALAYIATAAAILALGFGVSQCAGKVRVEGQLAKAEKALSSAQSDLSTCRGNVTTLRASVAAQNEAVEALRREGEARVAESAKAVRSARAVAESARRDAARILAMKPASADRCEAARRLIAEVVG